MSFGGQTPTIIVLKEGTDASQGKAQILSNIQACLAVQDTVRSTLGPYGGDLLLADENGKQTITNDGATVMKVCWSHGDFSFHKADLHLAPGYSSPCRPHPYRHSPLPRR